MVIRGWFRLQLAGHYLLVWWWNDWVGVVRALAEIAFPSIYIAASGGVAYRDLKGVGKLFFDEGANATFTA